MIRKIRLENWRSHKETTVKLDDGVNGLIGNMGSGKSSVLEAVTFALYGTTSSLNTRDIKLDDVLRRTPTEVDEAGVEVFLEIEGREYRVRREIQREKGTSSSTLYRDGEEIEGPATTDVTEAVEKLTGMAFKSFTRAVYSEQNRLDLFLEMRPGKRKERLDQLLKLEKFEEARKTLVKLENSLKNRLENHQEELAGLEDELDREELEALKEEIENDRKRKLELEEDLERINSRLEEQNEEVKELKQEKKHSEKLESDITRVETRIESLEEQLPETQVENPVEKLEESRKRLEQLREQGKKRERMKSKLENLRDSIDRLEEQAEELREKKDSLKELDGLEGSLKDARGKIENHRREKASIESKLEQLDERRDTLEDSDGVCPVCRQPLDDDHRREMVEELENDEEELQERLHQVEEEAEKLDEEIEQLESKRDELLRFRNAGERLEDTLEEKEEVSDKISELEDEIPDRPDIEKTEERIEKLESAVERVELLEKIENMEDKLEILEKQHEEVQHDPEELEALRESLSEMREERSRRKQEAESLHELLREKAKRLNQLERQWEKRKNLENEMERLDRLLDFSHDYGNALKKSQKQLRQKFIQRLNQLMDDLWSQVYPYDHYYSIRLNPERDYSLELLDSSNNWVSAQGEASGGERHSAALVMRLGLVFILSPRTGFLILDEPTHNIDDSGVSELADTLRERTSKLVDQLVIVTHDRELESATTGKLYHFKKDRGVTSVSEVS